MRIAVTYEGGSIFQHFGHTRQFKIYDVQEGKILASEVVDTNGSGHGALAGLLSALHADVLICGGIAVVHRWRWQRQASSSMEAFPAVRMQPWKHWRQVSWFTIPISNAVTTAGTTIVAGATPVEIMVATNVILSRKTLKIRLY